MKDSYSYCKKYDRWCNVIENTGIIISHNDDCNLECKDCIYHEIKWVEED